MDEAKKKNADHQEDGTKEIEAWDEEDAREQFCVDSIYDYDDGGIRNAEITDIVEVKPRRKGKK